MAFIDMNTNQFYQPPKAAGTLKDGQPAVSSLHPSTAPRKSDDPTALKSSMKESEILYNYHELSGIVDMTASLPKEPLDLFQMSPPNLDSTQTTAEDILSGFIATHDHGYSSGEGGDKFLNFEKLLPGPGGVQEWQGISSIDDHKTGELDGNIKHTTEDDRNRRASPRLSDSEHKEEWITADDNCLDDSSLVVQQDAISQDNLKRTINTNDDDIEFEALRKLPPRIFRYPSGRGPQDRDMKSTLNTGNSGNPIMIQKDTDSSSDNTSCGHEGPLSTPSTSVAGSEASLPKMNGCGNPKGLTPDQSTDDDEKDQQDDNEAETADEERFGDDSEQGTSFIQRSTKKRPSSAVGAQVQRRKKRCRFSSRAPSDSETETGDESDISSYAPSLPRKSRLTSSFSIGPVVPIDDDAMVSQTAVVYEQQRWKGRIVGERSVKHGRGRPRTQYYIEWEPSWVDGGRLNSSDLARSWKLKTA